MAHAGGRPTKLTPELVDKAHEYLAETSVMGVHALLPTIEGLALLLKINRETLRMWEQENEEFSGILGELRQAQAQKIIQNVLIGRYNPLISKLLLSKHGYIEQSDVTSGGQPISFNNGVPRPNDI